MKGTTPFEAAFEAAFEATFEATYLGPLLGRKKEERAGPGPPSFRTSNYFLRTLTLTFLVRFRNFELCCFLRFGTLNFILDERAC